MRLASVLQGHFSRSHSSRACYKLTLQQLALVPLLHKFLWTLWREKLDSLNSQLNWTAD